MNKEKLSKFNAIIIDEDLILKTVIPSQVSVTINDLKKLLNTAPENITARKIKQDDYNALREKIQKMLEASKTKTYIELSGFKLHYEDEEYNEKVKKSAIDGTSTHIDVPSFCLAKRFYFRKTSIKEENLAEDTIVFLKPVKLKKEFKYIIISATANKDVYNHYFGEDRVKFYECKKAEYKGTLNQFYDKPMSRTCIHNNPGIIDRIKEITGFNHTITFKIFAKKGELYFGNNEGVDYLKGENINVIGTPHCTEFIYKLFAYTIGLNFDKDAKPIPNLPVTHNGYRFHFTTYEDDELRKIQFWMIESELEQAVGRARLLRYDCTVNLFSNFPLSQAVMKKFDYEKNATK
jgi:hypothetical protein